MSISENPIAGKHIEGRNVFPPLFSEYSANSRFVNLFQKEAWENVEQSFVELAKTRSNVEKLQHQLQIRKKEAGLEVSGTVEELHNDTLAV